MSYHITESKFLPYNSIDLFEIILDISAYSEFLPWCSNSKILSNSPYIIAELEISFKGFKDSYQSQVITYSSGDYYSIDVKAISGPFKSLTNKWELKNKPNGCELTFTIDFEFRNLILNKLVGFVFKNAVSTMSNAFEKRAELLLATKN